MSFSISAVRMKPSAEMVYCPLQGEWVERSPQDQTITGFNLDEICADGKDKVDFVRLLASKSLADLKTLSKFAAGDVFLQYSASGERALREVPTAPTPPDLPLVTSAGESSSVSVFRINLHGPAAALVSVNLLPTPPTVESTLDFPSIKLGPSESRSTSAAPRAPPISA